MTHSTLTTSLLGSNTSHRLDENNVISDYICFLPMHDRVGPTERGTTKYRVTPILLFVSVLSQYHHFNSIELTKYAMQVPYTDPAVYTVYWESSAEEKFRELPSLP